MREGLTHYTLFTKSGLLTSQPCVLCCILVTSDGTATYADVFEGRNEDGKPMMRIRAGANLSRQFNIADGVYVENGVYLELDSHVSHLTVFWKPIGRG